MKPNHPTAPPPAQPTGPRTAVYPGERTIASQTLFAGAKTVAITHQGERYQLRITRQGKLILTK